MAQATVFGPCVSWESIKHKFVGGPYAGAGGTAAVGGSVGVEEFEDDAEAIQAIRLFPGVMESFGALDETAKDEQIKEKFLPALKVMLPHGGYFHDTLYNIEVKDADTITCTTGDMQLTAPPDGHREHWGFPQAGMPVFTTMRVLHDKVEMDLHGVEKWAWLRPDAAPVVYTWTARGIDQVKGEGDFERLDSPIVASKVTAAQISSFKSAGVDPEIMMGNGWWLTQAPVDVLYLPELVGGARFIEPQAEDGTFKYTPPEPRSCTYRLSPNMDDRDPWGRVVQAGEVVKGELSNGWLMTQAPKVT